MSNSIKGYVRRVAASLTMASTVLSMAGFAAFPVVARAVAPADFGLTEGNVIRATGDIDLYIVNQMGFKRLFVNPAIFNLYGHLGWNKVKEVAPSTRDAFKTSGLFRVDGDTKVYGLDVISEDVANLRWVNTSGEQAVIDQPDFFNRVFVINALEKALYGTGADYTSVLQVPDYSRAIVSQGSVSASLASDNPAAGTIISGQAAADLAHFSFSGSGAVTTLVLMRTGVSSDTTLSNVYLYMGSKRLTDAAAVSQGKITFSDSAGLFSVNGSAKISVKADILTGVSGQTVGVSLFSFNSISSALSGNMFSIAAAPSDFGTVTLGAPTPSAGTTLDPQNDYVMWQSTATIGTHDAWLKSLQLRVIGSVQAGDLRNFRLFADGIQVGSAVSQTDAGGYVVFDMNASPYLLKAGGRVLKLVGDVVGGSNRNFIVSLRQKPDIAVVESQYNQPMLLGTATPLTAPTQTLGTEVQAINAGTLTITKNTTSPSGDVIKDSTGTPLVSYKFEARGESLKIESLVAQFVPTNDATLGSIRNGAIFVDGAQVGSIQSISSVSAGTTFNLGSSLVVVPGAPRTVEVRGDIYDNTGTNNMSDGDTFHMDLIAGASNVQRLTSLNYFSSSAPTVGNTVTVRTGSFTAAKYTGYANQSVVTPKTQFKLGHYTLTAASSEAVNVNTIVLDFDGTNDGAVASKAADVFFRVTSDTGSVVYTSQPKATVSTAASASYSVNFTIPVNKVYQVEVIGNLNTVAGTGKTLITHMLASGLTVNSSTTATTSEVVGQTVTTQTGVLTKANGSLQSARLARGGDTVNGYAFTLQPAYDDFTLDEVYVDISSTLASSTGAIAQLILKDGAGNAIGNPANINAITGSASFTGLNKLLSQAGGTQTFKVDVVLAGVAGSGGNDTQGNVVVRLDGLKYRDGSGNITTQNGYAPGSFGGNSIISVAGYPVFANQALSTTLLSAGQKEIFNTKVFSVGTGATLKRLVFSIGRTSGVLIGTVGANNLTNSTYVITKDGNDITSMGAIATGSADLHVVGTTTGAVSFTWTGDEPLEAAGHVYALKVNVTSAGTTQTLVTSLANNSVTLTTSAKGNDATLMPAVPLITSPSVVWSDSSSVGHSLTTTDDWFNDYLVKTIAVSQAINN